MVAALGLNGSILVALILIPLIYPDALPHVGPLILMEAPPPPVEQPKPPVKPEHAVTVRPQLPDGSFTAPRVIPNIIFKPENPEVLKPMNVAEWADAAGNGAVGNNPFAGREPAPVVREQPRGPVRISTTEMSAPIYRSTPVYPAIAKATGTQGTVVLQAVISKTGAIKNLRVVSGSPMLQQAALDAVGHWRYRPFLLNGEPVEVETTVNVVFSLGR